MSEFGSITKESTVQRSSASTVQLHSANTEQPEGGKLKRLPVRLPASLVPTHAKRFDAREMEEWVIGSIMCNYRRMFNAYPCIQQIEKMSGRSYRSVRNTIGRLMDKGWIGAVKNRHEYAPGKFGHRWVFWVTSDSPLRALLDHKPGDGFRWIAVPAEVARHRSILAVGAYLMFHEQMRRDGAIATTPSDVAGILHCDRTTAWRILRYVGARAATEPRSGHVLYTMPTLYGAAITLMEYAGEVVTVPGHLKDKMRERLDKACSLLEAAGTDSAHELREIFSELIVSDATRCPSAALVLRVMEERNRAVFASNDMYGLVLSQRFGWRLKGLRRSAFRVQTYDGGLERQAVRQELRSALSRALCDEPGCDDGWIDTEAADGTRSAHRCTVCTT